MEKIKIKLYSKGPHISQILTGFCMLQRNDKMNQCRLEMESSAGIIKGSL